MMTDFSQSLESLEACNWGEPEPGATNMVRQVYLLRRKPLDSLTNNEVRLAVGQAVGVPFILDLAFMRLEQDPLLEGGCYPGDILSSLIRADATIWDQRPVLRAKLTELYERAMNGPSDDLCSFRESLNLPEGNAGVN